MGPHQLMSPCQPYFFFFTLLKAAGPIPHPTLCALLSEIVELLAKLGFMVAAELTKQLNK